MTQQQEMREELLGSLLRGHFESTQPEAASELWGATDDRCWLSGAFVGILMSYSEPGFIDYITEFLSIRLAGLEPFGSQMQESIAEHLAAICLQHAPDDFDGKDPWSRLVSMVASDFGIGVQERSAPRSCTDEGALLSAACLIHLLSEGWSETVDARLRELSHHPKWVWINETIDQARLVHDMKSIIFPTDLLEQLGEMTPMARSRFLEAAIDDQGQPLRAVPELDLKRRLISWVFRVPVAREPVRVKLLLRGIEMGLLSIERDPDWNIRSKEPTGLFLRMLGGTQIEKLVPYSMAAAKDEQTASNEMWSCGLRAGDQELFLELKWHEVSRR